LVAEKTGHRSSAVRSYKRTSDEQLAKVSDILEGKQCVNPQNLLKNPNFHAFQLKKPFPVTLGSYVLVLGDVSFTLQF